MAVGIIVVTDTTAATAIAAMDTNSVTAATDPILAIITAAVDTDTVCPDMVSREVVSACRSAEVIRTDTVVTAAMDTGEAATGTADMDLPMSEFQSMVSRGQSTRRTETTAMRRTIPIDQVHGEAILRNLPTDTATIAFRQPTTSYPTVRASIRK